MIKKTLAFMLLPTMIFILPIIVGTIWGADVLVKVLAAFVVAFLFVFLFGVFGIASYDMFFRGRK